MLVSTPLTRMLLAIKELTPELVRWFYKTAGIEDILKQKITRAG